VALPLHHGAYDADEQIEKRIKLGGACLMTAVGIPMFLAGEEFGDDNQFFNCLGQVSESGGKQANLVNTTAVLPCFPPIKTLPTTSVTGARRRIHVMRETVASETLTQGNVQTKRKAEVPGWSGWHALLGNLGTPPSRYAYNEPRIEAIAWPAIPNKMERASHSTRQGI
jgi:hypothetical protein